MGVAYIGKAIKLENFAFSVFGKFAEKKYADPGIVTKVCKSYKIYIFRPVRQCVEIIQWICVSSKDKSNNWT